MMTFSSSVIHRLTNLLTYLETRLHKHISCTIFDSHFSVNVLLVLGTVFSVMLIFFLSSFKKSISSVNFSDTLNNLWVRFFFADFFLSNLLFHFYGCRNVIIASANSMNE